MNIVFGIKWRFLGPESRVFLRKTGPELTSVPIFFYK